MSNMHLKWFHNLIFTVAALIFSAYLVAFSFSPLMMTIQQEVVGGSPTVPEVYSPGWMWLGLLAIVVSTVVLVLNVRSWVHEPKRWFVWLLLTIGSAQAVFLSMGAVLIIGMLPSMLR